MDADRFDDVLRQWGSSRRPVLGAGLGALLGLAGLEIVDAKKKKKKKKCKAPRVKCGKTCCATGASCLNGVCTPPCPSGQTRCGGTCVDTASDEANCGACGTACQAGLPCAGGLCRATSGTCTAGQDSCGAVVEAITCNPASGISDCYCSTSVSGETVCARVLASMPCGCTTDAECQTRTFPADLGGGTYANAFCIKAPPGGRCSGFCSANICTIPCQPLRGEN